MGMGLEEALAMNYLQAAVAANISYVWAWVAFLTAAAISFWKIKLSSSVVHSSLRLCLSPSPSLSYQPGTAASGVTDDDCQQQQQEQEREEEEEEPLTSSSSSNSKSIIGTSMYTAFCSMENRRSGKFSTYYYDDNTTTQSNFAGRSDGRLKTGCSIITPHDHDHKEQKQELLSSRSSINFFQQTKSGWEWEPVLLKMKTTEMVWYRYQDLTVLDGNVVRLWN